MRVVCSFTIDTARLDAAPGKLRERFGALTLAAAAHAQRLMVVAMDGPKSGYAYERGSRVHVASAPGQAPAIDTGFLASSIQIARESPLSSLVTAGAEYAVHLEYGTVRMAPRPFFRVSVQKAGDWFMAAAARLVEEAVR